MSYLKNPKTIILTVPLRSAPSNYLPIGSLAVVTSLRRAGFADSYLYDIDWFRPDVNEVIEHLKKEKPDILGISAVVSGSYEYAKKISFEAKKILPHTTIIMGGPMGASADVILKKSDVDFICLGEGERTVIDFLKCWQTATQKSDYTNIKGLAFLDENESLVVTPYADAIDASEVYDIDWSLAYETKILDFWFDNFSNEEVENVFSHDPRKDEPHRQGKNAIMLVSSKGCVARCSFLPTMGKRYPIYPSSNANEKNRLFYKKPRCGIRQFRG